MPYFLRELYSNTKWERTRFPSWLREGELPSCIIRDLRADDNALSLWEIQDDKSNLPYVVAALVASKRKSIKNDFDYALLDEKDLDQIRFKPIKKAGLTPYKDVNSYHYDVPNLSVNSVVYFAHLLSKRGKLDRMGWKQIETQLKVAHTRGELDLANIDPNLKHQLGMSS